MSPVREEKKVLRLSRIHHVQGEENELKFLLLFLVLALFVFSNDYFLCSIAPSDTICLTNNQKAEDTEH